MTNKTRKKLRVGATLVYLAFVALNLFSAGFIRVGAAFAHIFVVVVMTLAWFHFLDTFQDV